MLATGLIVAYAYMMETFNAWYSGNVYEHAAIWHRMTGPYHVAYWCLIACNILAPQALWFKKMRTKPVLLFISSIVVLIGMWLERYVIIVSSLAQDYLPSSWGIFQATRWDWATYVGTIGLFLFLFFLFIRLLPMISIFEVRTLLPQAKVEEEVGGLNQAGLRTDGGVRESHRAGGGRAGGAREGLPQAGRLLAVPHRGADATRSICTTTNCR